MIAEVIAIGDEFTSGQRLDTNSQWLSERLGEIGVAVVYHTTVADEIEANVNVFRTAVDRADVVIATGGLGPTADDLTREALAQMIQRPLVMHDDVLEHIKALFARFGREMPQRNHVQALFPEGSHVIDNPFGTAPGIDLVVPRAAGGSCRIFALPGVPAEMKQMWEATLVGILSGGEQGIRVIRHKRIKCFGVGESHLEKMLPDMIRRGRDPKVGITVSQATITLRITAAGETPDECAAKMEPTLLEVHQCLGELVFGTEEDELQHAVARLITNSDQTLATVECGTGGLVAHWIDEVDAMETRFVGGLIIPHPDALPRMLEIPLSLIQQHGAVSSEVTSAMAEACRQRTGADLALAVCQKSLPLQQGDENRIYVALARESGTIVRSTHSLGHPELHKPRAAKTALNLLRLALLRKDKPGQETTDHETTDKP